MNALVRIRIKNDRIFLVSSVGMIEIGSISEINGRFFIEINGSTLHSSNCRPSEDKIYGMICRTTSQYKNKRTISLKIERFGNEFFVCGAKVGFADGNELYIYDNRRAMGFRCISTSGGGESEISEALGKNYGWYEIGNKKQFLFHKSISNFIGSVSEMADGSFVAAMPNREDRFFDDEHSAIDFVESVLEDKSRNHIIDYEVRDGVILTPSGARVGVVEEDGAVMLIDKSKKSGFRLVGFGDPIKETESALGKEVRWEGRATEKLFIGWIEIGRIVSISWPTQVFSFNNNGEEVFVGHFDWDRREDAEKAAVYGLDTRFSCTERFGYKVYSCNEVAK